jgi:hydroxymethylpyrimidine/phosphomethylpyrimidine kinase
LKLKRPLVLILAGFDPCGGAGMLADIKTLEQHKVMGMGAVTALTFQHEDEFVGVNWVEPNEIIKQIDILFKKYTFEVVKIGMAKDLETILHLTNHLRSKNPAIKIIWDPILKASAGFLIHSTLNKQLLEGICKNCFLITPNTDEVKLLSAESDSMKGAKHLSAYCNVFLKGGHSIENRGRDYLFTSEGKQFPYKPKNSSAVGKHGSGCVVSSAIAAQVANGCNLQRACLKAKDYATKFLTSNKTVLGYHQL